MVIKDKTTDLLNAGFFGFVAIMFQPNDIAKLVEQFFISPHLVLSRRKALVFLLSPVFIDTKAA